MKTINLEELFDNNFDCYTEYGIEWECIDEQTAITKEKFKELCLVFGKQLLELAAENAKSIDPVHSWNTPIVDKQSIINTINQVI